MKRTVAATATNATEIFTQQEPASFEGLTD
jgi:hypothetical protein